MSVHTADDVQFEDIQSWRVSPSVWLWVKNFIAAIGLSIFIGSAWLLTALVQAALPN